MVTVTAFYASLLALVFIVLSVNTISTRRKAHVLLGDGGDEALLRYIRAHGNFAEYVPLALLLIALAELQGAPALLLHALGVLLLAGRLIHGFGISRRLTNLNYRVVGVFATFNTIIISSVTNIIMSVTRFGPLY